MKEFYTLSALFLGLATLTRFNLLFSAVIFMFLLALYKKRVFPFAIVFFSVFSLLGVRNWLACGELKFLPQIQSLLQGTYPEGFSYSFLLKRILFSLGFLNLLNADYRFRPHWLIAWAAYFAYLCFNKHKRLSLWEATTHSYIISYYGLLIFIAQVANYGFRMFIPAICFVPIFPLLRNGLQFHKKNSDL